MEKVLKLYKDIDGVRVAFPNSNDQIQTSDFTYSAQRMGGAPTISCTIMWGECLDNMWEGVYCEFNGEKYHIAKTPSSSKDNTDARYKHNVQFVSDRIKLDSVLFYNKVEENKNPLNTSTEFSFWGDVASFAERLNKSLEASKLEYSVVIDSGVTSEEKLFKAENMFVSSALQEINKTYGLMYYFVGTEIHVGEQQTFVNGLDLQYGFDKQLLSINKNNKNNKVVTRITGHGSDENIPYYYPNPTEKGTIEVVGEGQYMAGRVEVVNYHKFASSVNYNEVVRLQQTEKYVGSTKISSQYYKDGNYYSTDPLYGQFRPYKYSEEETKDGKILARISYNLYYTIYYADEGSAEITLLLPYKKSLIGTFSVDKISVKKAALTGTVPTSKIEWVDVASTPSLSDKDNYTKLSILIGEVNSTEYFPLHVIFDLCVETKKGNASLSDLKNYELYCYLEERISDRYVWKGEKKQSSNIEDFGLRLWDSSHFENNKTSYVGSGFFLRQVDYLQPSKYLMPSVYRKKKGNERFYNALNGVYTDEAKNDIVFINEFDESNPSEHVENFEDIKPTIKGVKNCFNEPIDCFSAFAYDLNDNDEIDEDGKYIHPYFFGKLRALDFNLFDQAIDSGEMTISMTSGHCASCEFTIGVDDNRQMNLVQVDENGNLVFDENGNVICGRKVFVDEEWITQSATPQDKQNNTANNEVWVALKKDTNTFGYVYPNKNIKPSTSDTFVILHIDLPQLYITNAEDKLDAALIEFMRKNNAEEFDYSVKFSRIFWEENPTILSAFNENARVNVIYNGEQPRQMYVSSLTYKCSSNEALPEISVSLSKELNIGTNTIQSVVNELKDFEGTVSILEQQSRAKAAPAIRKDIDDDAYGAVTFHQKPTFKDGIQSDKAIKVGIGASEGFADGTGTYIDERKIQVRDLEVRGSLKVTDLVASQIHSLDGEYIFTDTMKIDRVIPTSKTTCRLYFEKEYKNDFLKFYVNDILLSVVANIEDSDTDNNPVMVGNTGNSIRNISTDSFMQVTNTSGAMDDAIWIDVDILDNTSMPSDGAYVARKGNLGYDEYGLKRATSWSISVNDGRIVYYINQTAPTKEGNLKDNNYGLVIGRLPDITPVRNVGAVGEIGIYAKYLLAQHITQIRWAGNTQYVTIDRGDWDEKLVDKVDELGRPMYFYSEKTEGDITYVTRTKVEYAKCTWLCTGNTVQIKDEKDVVIKEYNNKKPSMDDGSGWSIVSGGDIVTETIIQYTTTQNNTQPTDYDTDGMAIGGDIVKWEVEQSACEYNALFPYMWKKTTTKTMSNPRGDTKIELIGVYGSTGLNAHLEVEGGNVIQVLCDSDLNAKGGNLFYKNVYFALDSNYIPVKNAYMIGSSHSWIANHVDVVGEIAYAKITLDIPKGWEVKTPCWIAFRLEAEDSNNGKKMEYTRDVRFDFTPNMSEASLNMQTSPSTAYIPVSEGKISANGFGSIVVNVIKGERALADSEYSITSVTPSYFGNKKDYISTDVDGSKVLFEYYEGTELDDSDYATIDIQLSNGLHSIVNILQNISGRDAVGEDAYSASVTPSQASVPVTQDNRIIGSPNYTFAASMFRGSGGEMDGTTITTTATAGGVFESVKFSGNILNVVLSSGEVVEHPIVITGQVINGNIKRPYSIPLSLVQNGGKGDMGYTGPVQRVWYDKLVNGQEYRNDSDSGSAIGLRYQDVLIVYCPDSVSDYLAFVCKRRFTYSGETKDLSGLTASEIKDAVLNIKGNTYFEEVAINASSAFFTQLFARNANIRMLGGATITMLSKGNKVVAGMSNAEPVEGEAKDKKHYHFWSGATNGDEASFSVTDKGELKANGADIQGVVKVNAMYYENILTNQNPNFEHELDPTKDSSTIVMGSGTFFLPNFKNFQGISYKFIQPNKSAIFASYIANINSGYFTDADGLDTTGKNTIVLSNGVIELLAIETGWCVLRYGTGSIKYSYVEYSDT